jgi:hypothetical protein
MLADAFAEIARSFSGMAGGPYHAARLLWPGTPTLDTGGSVTSAGTPTEADCEAQVDVATDAMRADADFQERDVRLLILADGLDTPPDDTARLAVDAGPNAGVYSIRSTGRDPAGVGYECRGRLMPGVTA